MFQVIIVPKDTGATACMYYNKEDDAVSALNSIDILSGGDWLMLKDDYGFVLKMDMRNLCYAMLIDVNKSSALHGAQSKKRIYDS